MDARDYLFEKHLQDDDEIALAAFLWRIDHEMGKYPAAFYESADAHRDAVINVMKKSDLKKKAKEK